MTAFINDDELIAAIQARPAIFDRDDKLHRNRDIISQFWSEIAAEVGADAMACKTRWQSLRDYFLRKYKERIKFGQTPPNKRQWPMFDSLSFLVPHLREASGNLETWNYTDDNGSVLSTEDINETYEKSPFELYEDQKPPTRIVVKKRKNESFDEIDAEVLQNTLKAPAENDHELFFRSLVPMVSKLNDIETLEFRSEVQGLVVKYLKRQQHEAHTSPSNDLQS